MSYRNGCFRTRHNVRVREIPEMETCMVFTPDDPEVYTLNAAAWLILRLCDGRTDVQIADAFHAAVEPVLSRDDALQEVRSGLKGLIDKGIIEVVPHRIAARGRPKTGRKRNAKRNRQSKRGVS